MSDYISNKHNVPLYDMHFTKCKLDDEGERVVNQYWCRICNDEDCWMFDIWGWTKSKVLMNPRGLDRIRICTRCGHWDGPWIPAAW